MSKPEAKVSYLHYKVLPHESQEQFDALLAEYRRAFTPSGIHEDFLVDDMAQQHWNIARMCRIEEHAKSVPGGLKTIQRYANESRRNFRRSHKMLQQSRKMNGLRDKDTPERRMLREFANEGVIPPELAIPQADAPPPSLEALFGDQDPFAPRA